MEQVYLSIGSNLGNRRETIESAVRMLEECPGIENIKQSCFYETEPVGFSSQPKFINVVIRFFCSYSPHKLLYITQNIEMMLGRKKTFRWGPRVIDIDIIIYGEKKIYTDNLIIPHPRMYERAFVLIPLADLDDKYKKYLLSLPRGEINGVKKIQGDTDVEN